MGNNFKNIVIFLLLLTVIFVVSLFITEAATPKYTYNHNSNATVNSPDSSLRFSSKENLFSSNIEVLNPENSGESNRHSMAIGSLQTSKKVKKRIKRQASSNNVTNELFAWNFNLNITRFENVSVQEGIKKDSNTPAGNKLGVAVYVESQAGRETALSEIQKSLSLAGAFIKRLFDGDTENATNEFKDLKSSETSGLQTSQNTDISDFGDVDNKNESLVKKERTGRIFFDIFRFGGKLFGRSTSVSETETTQNSVDETKVFSTDQSTSDILALKSKFVTENSQKASFHSASLFKTEHPLTGSNEENVEKLGSQFNMQQNECSDCITDSFESSIIPNEINEDIVQETDSTEPMLIDEILRNFCVNLLNNLEESILFSDGAQNDPDSEFSVKNKHLISPQNPILDALSVHITSDVKTSETDVAVEDSLLINNDESTTESTVLTNKDKRFFNMFGFGSGRSEIVEDETDLLSGRFFNMFGFGSGRSEITGDEIDLLSGGQGENTETSRNLSFVLGCESFFRRKNIKLPELNSLDKNDLRSEILLDFTNTTSSSKFQEHELRFLALLTSLNNSFQTFNEGSRNESTDLGENKTSIDDKSDLTTNKDLLIKNEETKPETNDFRSNDELKISESTEIDEVERTTDGQRDGKFLSIFGLGSGDEDENESGSRWFINAFGSSGERSLDTPDDLNESNATDFRSGKIEDFSEDGQLFTISDRDLTEDFNTASVQERFLSLLGFAGSGDGRELTRDAEFVATESGPHDECGSNCSHNVSDQSYECDDCDFESLHDTENNYSTELMIPIPLNESDFDPHTENDCDDCDYEIDILHGKRITETITAFETSTQSYQIDAFPSDSRVNGTHDTTSHVLESLTTTEIPHKRNKTAEMENPRFMGTIFLTGSGDGGLFGDNAGPINLVEEESTISAVASSRRRGRLEDSSHNPCLDCGKHSDFDLLDDQKNGSSSFVNSSSGLILTKTKDGVSSSSTNRPINRVDQESTVSTVLSRRVGRLDDSWSNECDDCGELSDLLDQSNQTSSPVSSSTGLIPTKSKNNVSLFSTRRPKGEETAFKSSVSNTGDIFSSVTFSNNPLLPSDVPISPTELGPRSCIGAKDCNITLNERCLTINKSLICACGRTQMRHKETGVCVDKVHVETTLKLPAEVFDANLKNPDSPRYKHMEEKTIETMWFLLKDSPELMRIISDVKVVTFTSGSLIIKVDLVLAVGNEFEVDSIHVMKDNLQKALGDENLIKKASLNIRNASVLSIFREVNPCNSPVLNYCHKNAYCAFHEALPGMFTCTCKDHYLDASSDPLYPGEICIAKCPPEYCGPNGHCEIMGDDKRHCMCNGLYFGERCEFPGTTILAFVSIAAFVSIVVLIAVLVAIRCRKRNHGRTPTFRRSEEIGPHAIVDGRVSDVVALGEYRGAKVAKFTHIGTPKQGPPFIKITRPTLDDSSLSMDFDSSFNETPKSSSENQQQQK